MESTATTNAATSSHPTATPSAIFAGLVTAPDRSENRGPGRLFVYRHNRYRL